MPFALACSSLSEEEAKAAIEEGRIKADKPDYMIMFKYGDDIKQDHLALQIFSVFNKIWI